MVADQKMFEVQAQLVGQILGLAQERGQRLQAQFDVSEQTSFVRVLAADAVCQLERLAEIVQQRAHDEDFLVHSGIKDADGPA